MPGPGHQLGPLVGQEMARIRHQLQFHVHVRKPLEHLRHDAAPMRVDVVDPSAYTPPYDHALCAALARAGAQVRLVTSRFAYGPVPREEGYEVRESFYRLAVGPPGSRTRQAAKLAQEVPDMLRYRRAARAADIVHLQWLTVQPLDVHLLPNDRPLVLTAR